MSVAITASPILVNVTRSHSSDFLKIRYASFRVWIAVSDTGRGIPGRELDKIFLSFHQANPESDGLGQGLAIAKRYMDAHSGKITVESTKGKGSKFICSLPVKRTDESSKLQKTVLLAIDDKDSMAFIKFLLNREEYLVHSAWTGGECMEVLDSSRPDYMLIDLTLSDMGALEVINHARKKHSGVLIVVLSAQPEAELIKLVAEYDLAGYLSKPFEIQPFMEMLDKLRRIVETCE